MQPRLFECNGEFLTSLPLSFFPEQDKKAGTVTSLAWTPDGCAMAMTWSKGGVAVWSVFGALLTCTLQSDFW